MSPTRDVPVETRDGVSDELIERARRGEMAAREALVERSWGELRRFAHGRLPARLRAAYDTEDLVQSSMKRALTRLASFEVRGPNSFQAFVRRILINRLRDLIRAGRATHPHDPPPDHLALPGPQPADDADHAAIRRAYEAELSRLTASQRSATVMRFELGWSHARIATELGLPSAEAARMCVLRGAVRLRRALRNFHPASGT